MLAALTILTEVPAAGLAGYWTNKAHSVVVLIAPCEQQKWCGTVASASDKAKADAARGGTASLVGTEIMHGFRPVSGSKWRGTLFVPDLNRRSKAELVQVSADRIRVRGCAVGRLLCKSQDWMRTEAP